MSFGSCKGIGLSPTTAIGEAFDEFMGRIRGDCERFAKEQEEYFQHMHARAPFRLLWWRLRDAFRTAARDLARVFGTEL